MVFIRTTAQYCWKHAAALAAAAFVVVPPTMIPTVDHHHHAALNRHRRVSCSSTSSIDRQQQHPHVWPLEESDAYYYQQVELPSRATLKSHAIYGQLLREHCIERYTVYKRIENIQHPTSESTSSLNNNSNKNKELVLADIQLGSHVDGHKGIVHGGILSLLLDDACGFAFYAMGIPHAVTANLTVNYRQPVMANTRVIIRVKLTKQEGRKLHFSMQLTSPDAQVIYVEATSLYIIPRGDSA